MTGQHTMTSAAYDADVAEIYDLLYAGRGKDFAAEADAVARVVRDRRPQARSVLDVACGTGEHLRRLAAAFPEVAGLELSPAMCTVAEAKLPSGTVHVGDMRSFALGREFDAVCILTGTIGYARDVDELCATVRTMAAHLAPGGVLVIDPWWSPDTFLDGHVAHDVVHDDTRTVVRVSHSARQGLAARHEAHYVVADGGGIRHFSHVQMLTLFTREDYLGALRSAGCTAEHLTDAGGLPGRGLFAGVRR
ncbi:class I SAM-dependent methyltransferase [Micromonospora profundi]|uniref:class I SAM-dependent methyltransferase n=1 Tax=Micromonospora profundi TaxID=1420889 RepID=UPI00368FB5C6